MSTFETYYDQNPIAAIDRNQWVWVDPFIDVMFRNKSIFTPLVRFADYTPTASQITTGRELLPGHVNHNNIGLRQKYITAAYFDSRERKIQSNKRYGAKVQYDHYDPLINQWQTRGRAGFAAGILGQHLNRSMLVTHEKLARDAVLTNVNVKTYAGGATNFATLAGTSSFKFDIQELRDVKLRLSVRVKDAMQEWGEYDGAPVPGVNDMLVITTPGVIYDIWDQIDSKYMMDLRDLGDERIINGGQVRYKGWTFVESWDALLWNAGVISKQVSVILPITAGDGAPDPDVTAAVDGVYYVGQSSSGIRHYVQCSDLGTSAFAAGDFVTLHVARTTGNGVTDGVDPLDGQTMQLEVYSVDETNERLTFRMPVMDDYTDSFTVSTLAGSAVSPAVAAYAFITKAAHVHPVYQIGARGSSLFAIRQPIRTHVPPAIDDFMSVVRVSWDEYGEMNPWQKDLHEVNFVRGSFGNRGSISV